MCGITGWVDFESDLRSQRAIVEAMTETMSLRGPDDGGAWVAPHAALGHRRLAVIDPRGGVQPMVRDSAVLTYSGEVYNYRELRRELIGKGHEFTTQSDTEVVLRAYLEWGEDFIGKLNGMYGFAIWDSAKEELLLIRDRVGVKPVYYYPTPNGIIFGSEPKAILANPMAHRKVDLDGFCSFLMLQANMGGHTPFDGLIELQPGEYLRVTRAGIEKRRYWQLEARTHEDDLDTTVTKVRSLMEDIVERQLVSDVPLGMLLSGGIDSSLLTSLAARSNGNSDVLHSFSIDFVGYSASFDQAADALRGTDDGPFIQQVVDYVGCLHKGISVDTSDLSDPGVRRAVLRAWDLPNHLADMDVSLYLLFRAVREYCTVAISGEGADEVFGGYPWVHDEKVLEVPIYPWMAFQVMQGTPGPFSLFSPDVIQRTGMLERLGGMYTEGLAEVPRLDGESALDARMREVNYLDLTRFMRALLDRKDRTSMAVGLEVRVPFCDHRLIEYLFNVPWSMKKRDGVGKWLLRAAAGDLLPESVLHRPKSAFPATLDTGYDDMLRTGLKQILDNGDDEPIRPFLNTEAAQQIVDGTDPAGGGAWKRLRTESVLRANAWIKEYEVDMSALS
ncbi:asparagine synthase (glutamine-hydrolyzing) [Nocardia sp. GCM10030253]|uniref:asparagine synthase (glutamine-hydrolyzing) n=1 Tax=Nocardia sp. GCM10030253 TaxID=3273404 RepID=UPI003624E560